MQDLYAVYVRDLLRKRDVRALDLRDLLCASRLLRGAGRSDLKRERRCECVRLPYGLCLSDVPFAR